MLLLTIFACLFYSTNALCRQGFELVRNGECHRQLYDSHDTYAATGAAEAVASCADYGAIPANIKNQEDHEYWVSVARNDKKKGRTFGNIILGIHCDANKQWKWADGRQLSTEWKPTNYDKDLDKPCFENGQFCMWTVNPITNNWQKSCDGWFATSDYCIITSSTNLPASDPECTNFALDENDTTCYQVGKTASNWTEANNICHSFGAFVASVHNERANNFVRRLAVSNGLVKGVMLGASMNPIKDKFVWADGTNWDYDNFGSGVPVDSAGECVAMMTNTVNGQWTSIDCATPLPFACIRQPDHKKPSCDGVPCKENDIIYSPGFPSDASIACNFELVVDFGMLVEVEILMLEANSCCDRLVLDEGEQQIASLSGEISSGRTFRTTSHNAMTVSWQPNGGVNVRGMMITFRGVPRT